MATPKTFTDNSSDLDEANLNLFLRAGKLQVKINYFQINFVTSTEIPTIVASRDSDGEVITADLTFATDRVNITLSGFTATPIVLATIFSSGLSSTMKTVQGRGNSTTSATVIFTDANFNPLDPSGDCDICVLIIGV